MFTLSVSLCLITKKSYDIKLIKVIGASQSLLQATNKRVIKDKNHFILTNQMKYHIQKTNEFMKLIVLKATYLTGNKER